VGSIVLESVAGVPGADEALRIDDVQNMAVHGNEIAGRQTDACDAGNRARLADMNGGRSTSIRSGVGTGIVTC
jgi:hypothetical protein